MKDRLERLQMKREERKSMLQERREMIDLLSALTKNME